ncbi:MAG: polyphosphate kinase 1 [Gemmatimonadaceae bacterium]
MALDPALFINRELSWLEFNARVLHEAFDPRNRLLERLKFLAIFSRNLDEFHMVRVAGLRRQIAAKVNYVPPDGMTAEQQLAAVTARVSALIEQQQRCLYDLLLPELEKHGIRLVNLKDLTPEERKIADQFFTTEVFPVLAPVTVEPGNKFPYITNLALSIAVQIYDPATDSSSFARVKVPKRLPRWFPFGQLGHFVPLEQIIAANLGALFPGKEIRACHTFRVIRFSDFEVSLSDDDDDDDLLTVIEEQIFQRRFAEVVRVEVETGTPEDLRKLLLDELRDDHPPEMPELTDFDLVEAGRLLDLARLMEITTLDMPQLRDPPFVPKVPIELQDESRSIFAAIRESDILVHHPFDSFSASVEHFLSAAAVDTNVLAIKMTLYRTSGDTEIVRALTEAARRGKRVAVVIELRARFDEVNNISWARALEAVGVNVGFGLPGYKTHAKIAVVLRREADGIRRYVHIGTGNYNSETARVYTDLGMLTSDQTIGADLTDLFNALTGFSSEDAYSNLLVAPRNMRQRFSEMIRREVKNARARKPARIIAKVNALVDAPIIEKLYEASKAGVEVDLIVRGICCLRPGVPGVSDRIRVISIVGRFLEHSRIFYFANAGNPELYFGSADWMPRNFDRRVEVIARIEDQRLHHRVGALLETCLADNRLAWDLNTDGTYTQRKPGKDPVVSTHERLLTNSWGLIPLPAPKRKTPRRTASRTRRG